MDIDVDDLRRLRAGASAKGTTEAWADVAMLWADGAAAEIARLKRGEFRPEEIQEFCHGLPDTVPEEQFAAGCARYQRQLYGRAPDADLLEACGMAMEADRSKLAEAVARMRRALLGREWLRLGRGSYEHDDDRWRDEFADVYEQLSSELEAMAKIAADWAHCPRRAAEVRDARTEWKERVLAAEERARSAETELERVREAINSPHTTSFLEGVRMEAVHQRERWGTDHDSGKNPEDWFWLVGYLSGKALNAAKSEALPRYRHKARGSTYEVVTVGEDENRRGTTVFVYRGEDDGKTWVRPADQFLDGRFEELPKEPSSKALHHCISTAAALMNWHAALSGADHRMRPGTDRRRGERRTGAPVPPGKAVAARASGDRRHGRGEDRRKRFEMRENMSMRTADDRRKPST